MDRGRSPARSSCCKECSNGTGRYRTPGKIAAATRTGTARDPLLDVRRTGRSFCEPALARQPDLRLPDVQDNLEVRLLLLQRRLAEQHAAIQLEKAGRGRMRLKVGRDIVLEREAE